MAQPVVDISLFGDKALKKALARLEPKLQKKVFRQTQRKSATRLRARITENLSGPVVDVHTGRYRDAMRKAPIRAFTNKRKRQKGVGVHMPERHLLGISPDDQWYYPFVVEYGTEKDRQGRGPVPAFAPIRRAVNDNARRELATMATDMKVGIEREAKRLPKAKVR